MSDVAAATAQSAPPQSATPPASPGLPLWSHGSFSFKDLLDIVNPLQHLPVIGSVYRYLTGDEPSGGARIIGDSIYGGPIGFGVAVVSTALLTDSSGRDVGERALASVFGPRDGAAPGATAVAAAAAPPPKALTVASAPQAAPPAPAGLMATPALPVAMNNLFRSAPPPAPATPEQAFLAQNARFQRQMTTVHATDGTTLNNHPVPLELSSNLLPVLPPGAHMSVAAPSNPAGAPSPGAAALPAASAADPNPLAQKMLDALNKYEQLKKEEDQQNQQDNADPTAPPKIDLTL